MCEFSRCYNDVNICLWTNASELTWSDAQSACEQRNSFLPRVTNSNIQSKLGEFRSAARNLLFVDDFWIDVKAVGINSFHWIDGSSLAGNFIYAHICCIVIGKIQYNNCIYNNNNTVCKAYTVIPMTSRGYCADSD